jgi:hypothetical protein
MAKVRIRILATDGCVASEYIYLYTVSINLQFNILIKLIIIMFMIKTHENICLLAYPLERGEHVPTVTICTCRLWRVFINQEQEVKQEKLKK